MGRLKSSKPNRPAGPSRRGFFTASGSAALALASAPMLALAHDDDDDEDDDRPGRGHVSFDHGVASGDPLRRRVILWTRVTPEKTPRKLFVRFVVARDPALRQVVERGIVRTGPERDYSVKLDAQGLKPGTTYFFRFFSRGVASPVGRTRTLPVGATSRLRLVVASCSNHAAGYFNAYRRIAARADLDAVLHLGDYLYDYGPAEYGSVRTPEPAREMVTLADYRMRHAQYKRDADWQAMHRQHPVIAIWDDHEITNDAWKDGAQNHTPATEGDWATRVSVDLQAYYEWMPVRQPVPQDPRRNQRSFAFGDPMDLNMLE